ncbi:hypothetical protein SAMN00768000_0366 [Sulfobacillus thermosulfidooxidans DSM 9293]|uniref:Uncharacterized protein n=1 Tax=Sulfobacillus thermosulfidooxidans (strain DSM 9293 / VKM B-1269 / AT-1) TaxID=929705 RepID=A0A1W1W796_SULTA|nr:hypothetical protein [Sulfobacillus thermosulfidooxidans]SMC02148.1 hypothetical protein SAMN00768000_0366 [Sulfobacillus thermosulfidooxidans DSM 9293]
MDNEKKEEKPLKTLSQEQFQQEVARELGIDLSPADHVKKRQNDEKTQGDIAE